jgi:bleomycin hydrolase
MYTPISPDLLNRFERDFAGDPVNALRMHAVVKHGVSDAAENHLEDVTNPMTFSIELESGKITDQKARGRCWLFAGAHTLRYEIMKKVNLKTFELSQNYQMFYDKLERPTTFWRAFSRPPGSRWTAHGQLPAANPLQDGGQWDMFCRA